MWRTIASFFLSVAKPIWNAVKVPIYALFGYMKGFWDALRYMERKNLKKQAEVSKEDRERWKRISGTPDYNGVQLDDVIAKLKRRGQWRD